MTALRFFFAVAVILACPSYAESAPREAEPLGLMMESYDYPYPVSYFPLKIEGQEVRMAYMDVPPAPSSGRPAAAEPDDAPTVLLLHGKNFLGAYWRDTIRALTEAGFRVVVPDQIGFGKSSKPAIAYSFHQLATNTRELLEHLKIPRVAVVGHSMGGMLATRFALMFPGMTSHLVLENPIGLEDYRRRVIYRPTSELVQQELAETEEQTRKYQQAYYAEWKPEYDEWVRVRAGLLRGPDARQFALVSALTSQMIYEQPVVYEFPLLRTPTLLVIGQEDRTAIGKDRVAQVVADQLGNYPQLGKEAARAIPRSKLIELENVGHIPHFEAPAKFHEALIDFISQVEPTAPAPAPSPSPNAGNR